MNRNFLAIRKVGLSDAVFGRIIFTASKVLSGVGFARAECNAIKDKLSGTITLQNLKSDYANVWAKLDANKKTNL